MYCLLSFFRHQAIESGVLMLPAIEQALQQSADDELLELRETAFAFAQLIEREYLARAVSTDVTPECEVNGCVLARGHNGDHLFDLEIGSIGESALELQ